MSPGSHVCISEARTAWGEGTLGLAPLKAEETSLTGQLMM